MTSQNYRVPNELEQGPFAIARAIVVGSCLAQAWPRIFMEEEMGLEADFYLFNNAAVLPDQLPSTLPYDFQVVQIPLRSVIPDYLYFRVDETIEHTFEELLQQAKERLGVMLRAAMKWNADHGLLTFVANFFTPQQNPLGKLMKRYDLGNMVHFVEQLNHEIAVQVESYPNAYLLDIDEIAATFGRRYIQDDALWQFNHGSALSNADQARDTQRLEPIAQRATDLFATRNKDFVCQVWAELRGMYRTLRQADSIKLVVVDIDDTLWRGVSAERLEWDNEQVEGWPLGVIDALKYLKRRGLLLAIASKNDEGRIKDIWTSLFRNKIALEDFVTRKINFLTKVENVEQILRETNLLPGNVLFIDDNPVERESIRTAFPGIRVMGGNPYTWRRTLLWAPETQVAALTDESVQRTAMVTAQIKRESQRSQVSRAEFLQSLELAVSVREIDRLEDPAFTRALELINKTNQFNTTGRRWLHQEFSEGLGKGLRLFVFKAKDVFTDYGIVGVVVIDGTELTQFVMSCRVVGMEVEYAALSQVLQHLKGSSVTARYIDTGLNILCRDFLRNAGFSLHGSAWTLTVGEATFPAHVRVTVE